MGRRQNDVSATTLVSSSSSSSIALLQERFRNLERVKENREKKGILKLYSGSEPVMLGQPVYFENTKMFGFNQPEMMMMMLPTNRPNLDQESLSLSLRLQTTNTSRTDFPVMNSTSFNNLRPGVPARSKQFDSCEIDTTLRL